MIRRPAPTGIGQMAYMGGLFSTGTGRREVRLGPIVTKDSAFHEYDVQVIW